MTDDLDVASELRKLDERQLGFVAGRLLDRLEQDTETSENDADREAEDEELLRAAADQLDLTASRGADDRNALAMVIAAVAEQSPENRILVVNAIKRAADPDLRLGPVTFTVVALALALAGAILRPQLKIESEKTARGTQKRRFHFEFRGVPNIAKVIKAVLPFLNRGTDGAESPSPPAAEDR